MSHPQGNDGGHGGGYGGSPSEGQGSWGTGYGQDSGTGNSAGFGGDGGTAGFGGDGGYGGPGGGAEYGQGSGNKYGTGAQYGSGNQYGFGNQYGPGNQYGSAGPGGPAGPGSPKKSKTGLIIGIAGGVVTLIVVVAIAVSMLGGGKNDGNGGGGGLFGPSEEEQRQQAADGVNQTMSSLTDFVSLVQWNSVVCQEYQGTEEGLRAADGFLSFLGGYRALFDFDLEDFNVTADQVTFTNEDRTEIEVNDRSGQSDGKNVVFRYEEETWKICDPNVDLRQFDDIDTLGS